MSNVRLFKKRKTSKRFTIEIRDEHGRPWRFAAFESEKTSLTLGGKYQALFNSARMRSDPEPYLIPWIDLLDQKTIARLVKGKILQPRIVARGILLSDLLATWEQHRVDLNVRARDAKLSRARLDRLFVACGFVYFHDLSSNDITEKLGEWRRRAERPLSLSTCNHYIVAAKGFSIWMKRSKRAGSDPLVDLAALSIKADQKMVRRYALTTEEQRLLLVKTAADESRFARYNTADGPNGKERAMIYRVALRTGLRAGECISLLRGDYDGAKLRVVGKNGEEDRVSVPADLKIILDAHAEMLLPTAHLLPCPNPHNMATMLSRDLVRAGIDPPPGFVVDFHALRHTFITSLARAGVHVKVAQRLARHKSISMTLAVYTQLNLTDDASAIEKLPDLDAAPSTENKASTG